TLAALKSRANKLAHQIEPSVKNQGYCLWQTWPDGRLMILGRNDGVTLDAIAEKLEEIEATNHEAGNDLVSAPQGCSVDLALAGPTPRRRRRQCRNDRREPLGEAEIARLYGNRGYA